MAQQNRKDITPGQQLGQSDPALSNPQNNDPSGTPQKSLFNISPELLSKLPSEVVEQMNKERQAWEVANTQYHQETSEEIRKLKSEKTQLEVMIQDPAFFQSAFNNIVGNQQPANQQQPDQPDIFARFGEEAPNVRGFMDTLKESMMPGFKQAIDDAVGPLRQDMVHSQRDREMNALAAWSEKNNLPHPSTVEAKIDMYRRRDPSMSYQEAYQASLDLESLFAARRDSQPAGQPVDQPPVQQPGQPPVQQPGQPLPPVGMMPSGGAVPSPSGGPDQGKDPVAVAIERRKAGIQPDFEQEFKKGIAENIAIYNAEHGTDVTLDDFQ